MTQNAAYWINILELQPHPEGGYYRETYKSSFEFGGKQTATLIYYLLQNNDFSAFHRLKNDEVWLFHSGISLTIYSINESGEFKTQICGDKIDVGEELQVFIPANTWFAAEINSADGYSLVSCLVTPGFLWQDFELGNVQTLIELYPQHVNMIKRLTQSGK